MSLEATHSTILIVLPFFVLVNQLAAWCDVVGGHFKLQILLVYVLPGSLGAYIPDLYLRSHSNELQEEMIN